MDVPSASRFEILVIQSQILAEIRSQRDVYLVTISWAIGWMLGGEIVGRLTDGALTKLVDRIAGSRCISGIRIVRRETALVRRCGVA
jgi:hypothetical protein